MKNSIERHSKVNRKKVSIIRYDKNDTNEVTNMTSAELLSFVWELTKEVYSLSGKYDVESRLQRDVISITRK